MFYFGYQKNQRGQYYGVKFNEDHAPSHRMVVSKFKITEEEFKWASWGNLKKKFPAPQQESNSNAPISQTSTQGGS